MAEKVVMEVSLIGFSSRFRAIFSDTEKCRDCQTKLLKLADNEGINRFCPICRNVYSSCDVGYVVVKGEKLDADTYKGSTQVIVSVAQKLRAQGYDLIALATEDMAKNYFVV